MLATERLIRFLWTALGIISLCFAYIGVITPGIPYSPFVVFAAYCFSKGSETMHNWIYSHKLFGPFLTNWTEKRVFPQQLKYLMLMMMSSSLIIMWFTTGNLRATIWTSGFMALVALWAWRYPNSVKEYNRRKLLNKKIGWIK